MGIGKNFLKLFAVGVVVLAAILGASFFVLNKADGEKHYSQKYTEQSNYTAQILSGSLVPCGLSNDDTATLEDERAPCTICHFFMLLHRIINWIILFISPALAIFFIVLGGFLIMISGGDAGQYQKGKDLIKWPLVGIAVLLVAWIFVNAFLQVVGVADWTGLGKWWEIKCEASAGTITSPAPPPAAHWKFDEGSGTVVRDAVGGVSGTINLGSRGNTDLNNAWEGSPQISAICFDGVDDVVSIPHNSSLQLDGEATVAVWIRPNAIHFPIAGPVGAIDPKGRSFGILSKGTAISTVRENYSLTLHGAGIRWRPCYNTSQNCAEKSGEVIEAKKWSHVVGVFKQGMVSEVYINGNRSGVFSSGGVILNEPLRKNTDPLTIGFGLGYWADYFNGAIDDVKIWQNELSTMQILEEFKNGSELSNSTTDICGG